MFDFIPLHLYSPIFYMAMLLLAVVTMLETLVFRIGSQLSFTFGTVIGYSLLLFVLLYMGLRPIDGVFVDMVSYNWTFELVQSGNRQPNYNDPVFSAFLVLCTSLMDAQGFFFVCAVIYVIPAYMACRKYFAQYWFYAFVMLVCTMSFWSYGVNGIRNGLATSIFLFALSREIKLHQWMWMALAVGFHKSMVLPTVAYALTLSYNNPRYYRLFWLACIPVSLVAGGAVAGFFAGLGFDDDRIAYLTTEADSEQFSRTGFRWDFLIYSAIPIFAGWYYTAIKKFDDVRYLQILNIYTFSNAIWILVIRANFSNRFAYLSWFMMALVLIYPLLKQKILAHQHIKIGLMILANAAFTYIMVSV
jgi:hypothetical protein